MFQHVALEDTPASLIEWNLSYSKYRSSYTASMFIKFLEQEILDLKEFKGTYFFAEEHYIRRFIYAESQEKAKALHFWTKHLPRCKYTKRHLDKIVAFNYFSRSRQYPL